MQTKTYHELQGEEILSQVKFKKETDWFGFGLTVGLIGFWCAVFYFFIH